VNAARDIRAGALEAPAKLLVPSGARGSDEHYSAAAIAAQDLD
jgi:hypothetical protein